MGLFSKEEFKLVVGNSNKKGSARRELRSRVRSKIANALTEIELAFSNAEVLINAEHLPAQTLKTAIAGFRTLGLHKIADDLEQLYELAICELARFKAIKEVR